MTYLPDQTSFQQPFTPDRQARFLEALSLSGNVRMACRSVGAAPNTAYRWRQASAEFALGWDYALVAARAAVEQVLADRALNGIDEPVFYHGEEIARRRRYSDRLLLAHLARLDALAERIEGRSESAAEGVTQGGANDRPKDMVEDRAGVVVADVVGVDASAIQANRSETQLSANSVLPPPTASFCPDCGGRCDDPRATALGLLGPQDCQWLDNRIKRMEGARPAGARSPDGLAAGDLSADAIEALQLEAFEADGNEWWLVTNAEGLLASCTHGFVWDGAGADEGPMDHDGFSN